MVEKNIKKKTLVVTGVAFWRLQIGCMQRVNRMMLYLKEHLDIKILFLGRFTNDDVALIKKIKFNKIIDSINDIEITQEELENIPQTPTKHLEKFYNHYYKIGFDKYLANNCFDNILIEYITLDYLVKDKFDNYKILIDTHDLMSKRTQSYQNHNDKPSISFENLEQEIDILKHYDYILSIQKNEYETLTNKIQKDKILLVQHANDINKNPNIKQKVKNIVCVSGPANAQHIVWFIKNVWIYFQDNKTISLNIYGTVCTKLQKFKNYKQINLVGAVERLDEIYKDADIVINPVLYGSGLKIKNVEAISYGLPLITTNEGSNGIEDGINKAYLLANKKDEWIEAILSLIISKQKREKLSKNALKYATENFNDKSCYQRIVDILK